MAIYRVHKKNDYTMINNYLIKDKNLQLKDKGMLLVLLSLPNDWDFSVAGLEKICKETKDTINGILNNLQKYNYLKREIKRDDKGRFIDWQYDIYEIPKDLYDDLPHPKNPDMDNPDMDFPDMENYTQLNTNKENTKKQNTKLKENVKRKYFDNEDLNNIFIEYLEMRKKMKAINSDRAINTLINKLSSYDDDMKFRMIEQSIVNSWKSIYEVKLSKQEIRKLKEKEIEEWLKEENNA